MTSIGRMSGGDRERDDVHRSVTSSRKLALSSRRWQTIA